MQESQKQTILDLRVQGLTYAEIAQAMELSPNTVKSVCRRSGIKLQQPEQISSELCKNCGKALHKQPGRKPRTFCSNRCRYEWWNKHRKKRVYHLICHQCGRQFISFGNKKRKFCGKDCYLASRYGEGLP